MHCLGLLFCFIHFISELFQQNLKPRLPGTDKPSSSEGFSLVLQIFRRLSNHVQLSPNQNEKLFQSLFYYTFILFIFSLLENPAILGDYRLESIIELVIADVE